MLLRNLTLYQIPSPWKVTLQDLRASLEANPLVDCPAASARSTGWISPDRSGELVYESEKRYLIALGIQQRLLPSSIVKQEVNARAAELEKQQGFPLGRKMLRDLKDRVAAELLARAFIKQSRVLAWIEPTQGVLAVDASSSSLADEVVSVLRSSLESSGGHALGAVIPQLESSAAFTLTQWLSAGHAQGAFSMLSESELVADNDDKASVKYARHDLDRPDVRQHISEGKRVAKLSLSWEDRVGFVVTDKLQIRRLQDFETHEPAEGNQTPQSAFEAEFALTSGNLAALVKDLFSAFGLKALAIETESGAAV